MQSQHCLLCSHCSPPHHPPGSGSPEPGTTQRSTLSHTLLCTCIDHKQYLECKACSKQNNSVKVVLNRVILLCVSGIGLWLMTLLHAQQLHYMYLCAVTVESFDCSGHTRGRESHAGNGLHLSPLLCRQTRLREIW